MARLLSDENFPMPVVRELRRLGHNIAELEETGRLSRWSLDDEILAVASATRRALLTLDHRSFGHLSSRDAHHAGIIICTFDPDFIRLANQVHIVLSTHANLDGQVIRVGRRRTMSA